MKRTAPARAGGGAGAKQTASSGEPKPLTAADMREVLDGVLGPGRYAPVGDDALERLGRVLAIALIGYRVFKEKAAEARSEARRENELSGALRDCIAARERELRGLERVAAEPDQRLMPPMLDDIIAAERRTIKAYRAALECSLLVPPWVDTSGYSEFWQDHALALARAFVHEVRRPDGQPVGTVTGRVAGKFVVKALAAAGVKVRQHVAAATNWLQEAEQRLRQD